MQETTSSESHIYQRHLDPDGKDSLAMIARRVPSNSQVLDLGVGTGVLGRYLTEVKQCQVDGVEKSEAQARIAESGYHRLEVVDLENCDLSSLFTERYDVIICADVLEHLKQPELVLNQLSERLATEGRILLSIPNIAYVGAILGLMAGEFRYRPEGILDQTHLRFFTRQSLIDFIHQQGFSIRSFDRVRLDLRESEFKHHFTDILPPAVLKQLTADEDALTYQFIVEITSGSSKVNEAIVPPKPQQLYFVTQLYWRFAKDQYSQTQRTSVLGKIGLLNQQLQLNIPELTVQPERLRLDLADRPGFVRIHTMTLIDGHRNLIWEWDQQGKSLSATDGAVVLGPLLDRSSVTVLVEDESSFIELPLTNTMLTRIQAGATLHLELSFPQSADFMALLPRIEMLEQQKDKELEAREALIQDRDELLEEQNQEITRRGQLIKEKDQMLELRNQQMSEYENLIEEREDVITNKDESLEEQNEEIIQLLALISNRDQILEARTGQMQERENLIQDREQVIQTKDRQLKEINKEKDKQLKELNQEVSFRGKLIQDRERVIQTKDRQLKELNQEVTFRGKLIQEREAVIQTKDHQLETLDQKVELSGKLIQEREAVIQTKDYQLEALDQKVELSGKLIQEREVVIQTKDQKLKEINKEKDKQLKALNQEVSFRGKLIQERDEWLELRNQQKDQYETIIQDQDRLLSEKDALLAKRASMRGWLKQPFSIAKFWFSQKLRSVT